MSKKFFDIIPPEKTNYSPVPLREKNFKKKDKFSFRSKKKEKSSRGIFLKGLFFLLILLILVGGFGFVFFSKVKIEIWPETDILNLEEVINVDLGAEELNFETRTIPGEFFSEQKSASQNFSASGKTLKEEKATGVIRVYNTYSTSSQALLPHTRFVSTDGKLFRSIKKEVISGGKYKEGKFVPGFTDIEVQAAESGEDYNIGPSTFSIPGFVGTAKYTDFYGESFEPMTGGFKGEVSQVTQEDLEKAEEILVEKVKKDSKDFLKTVTPENFILLDEAISQEIVETNSSVEVGDKTESFDFQVKIRSNGIGFRKSDIESIARNLISLNISEGKVIYEESLRIDYLLESIDLNSGKISLNLEIRTKVYSDINLVELKNALMGKSQEETKLFLENLPQIVKIEIKSWPFLKKKVPENLDKVEIRLNLYLSP